ncbi:MAG: hypothetical protein ABJB03_06455 [Rhodoglobus sp.]
MSEQTWSEFRLTAFGEPYMVWHDGPDFGEFARLWAADAPGVESLLRLGLDEQDALAAEALGEIALSDGSKAAFVALLAGSATASSGGYRVRAAQTLHQLTGNEHWSAQVVAVLLGPDFWTVHLDAARALATFAPTAELITAVAQGMTDKDYLVRYHSANTMLHYCGRPMDVYAVPNLFDRIAEDTKPKLWSLAAAELAAEALIRLHS